MGFPRHHNCFLFSCRYNDYNKDDEDVDNDVLVVDDNDDAFNALRLIILAGESWSVLLYCS